MGDYIYFKSFYSFVSYDPVNNVANTFLPQDNFVEYLNFFNNGGNTAYTYVGKDIKITLIDENFKKFIDDVFASIAPNQYWSPQRKKIFHNYLRNWGLSKIFQKKSYPKCTIHFNEVFYEWNMCGKNDTPQLTKLDYLQMSLTATHFINQSQQNFESNIGSDENNCLDFGLFPPPKNQGHNRALIKKYICYFTMNNADVLDNLALDYVNSLLLQAFSRKNTVFCGDYDKYYKWINLFSPAAIRSTGLIEFYPYLIPIQTVNLLNNRDVDIEKAIKDNAKEINVIRSVHKHFLVSPDFNLKNGLRKYVNYVDFPYGGEFYNLEPISDIDKLEIVKLLIVHGWNLLNQTKKPQKTVVKSLTKTLLEHLESTDETRIPLNVLYQIYRDFIGGKKSMTELHKELNANGYEYKTMQIRLCDKDYLNELSNQAKKHFHELDIPIANKQKAFSCKLTPEFWNDISPELKAKTEEKNVADFDAYLKELSEIYSDLFIDPLPEFPNPKKHDPYAGYTRPENFKDEDLQ